MFDYYLPLNFYHPVHGVNDPNRMAQGIPDNTQNSHSQFPSSRFSFWWFGRKLKIIGKSSRFCWLYGGTFLLKSY
jgi:hypothetical protein